jgi:solute carrier family 8 (sodium/calcium exchanger)
VFELPDDEDISDLMLKIAIESPEPQGVKISRKNIAIINITSDFQVED